MCPLLTREQQSGLDNWFPLQPRSHHENITGEIRLQISFERITKRHYGPDDFEVLRLIGKGKFYHYLGCSDGRMKPLLLTRTMCRNVWPGISGSKEGY
jgi:hypothetical protein